MRDVPEVAVVGSVNLDLVATVAQLPTPGETVGGATLARHPGGKGANQALAARRLGATVRLYAMVGADATADEALALLRDAGVDLTMLQVHASAATGVALVAVASRGENQIVVAPGANAQFLPAGLNLATCDALICQLEIPVDTVMHAAAQARGLICLNLAPACAIPTALLARADLIVVNETEAAFYGSSLDALPGMIATTLGARGAMLTQRGKQLAVAPAPRIQSVDSTGAGDAFVAALVVALLESRSPQWALGFACSAGAVAVGRPGAQPSLPTRAEVLAQMDEPR